MLPQRWLIFATGSRGHLNAKQEHSASASYEYRSLYSITWTHWQVPNCTWRSGASWKIVFSEKKMCKLLRLWHREAHILTGSGLPRTRSPWERKRILELLDPGNLSQSPSRSESPIAGFLISPVQSRFRAHILVPGPWRNAAYNRSRYNLVQFVYWGVGPQMPRQTCLWSNRQINNAKEKNLQAYNQQSTDSKGNLGNLIGKVKWFFSRKKKDPEQEAFRRA